MKKLLIVIVFFFAMISTAYAKVNLEGLTEVQKAELTIQAEKMKAEASTTLAPQISTIETATKWAEAGKSLAVGLGAGAKEIGIAVNEFAETRVGKITTYIIIWKLLGSDLLGLFIGMFILLVVMPIVWGVMKTLISNGIEYEDSTFFGIPMRRKKRVNFSIESESAATIAIIMIGIEVVMFILALIILPF